MNKLFLLVLLLFAITGTAQVKIGDRPTNIGSSSVLELESNSKALLITRIASPLSVITPTNGMIIYDTSLDCFRGYQAGKWSGCWNQTTAADPSTNGSGVVSSWICSTASAGTMTYGAAVQGVTQTITGNVTSLGSYSISATANGVTFAASGTFTATGSQNVILVATGTPTGSGTPVQFTINTTPNCNFNRNIVAQVSAWACSTASAGTMTYGTAVQGVTQTVTATVVSAGNYSSITATANGVTFAAPAGTFTATGPQTVVLAATGTPTGSGTPVTFTINTNPSCNFNRDITTPASIPNNTTCSAATISRTSCATVPGAIMNNDPNTPDGIEYDWPSATNTTLGGGFGATTGTQALVEIGGQYWARYNSSVYPTTSPPYYQSDNVDHGHVDPYYASSGPSSSVPNQGYLYQWSAAMNNNTAERSQGVCPTNWHIPSDCEFMFLENTLTMSTSDQQLIDNNNDYNDDYRSSGIVGKKLNAKNTANNSSGFTGLFSGYRAYQPNPNNLANQGYYNLGAVARWYSSTIDSTSFGNNNPFTRQIGADVNGVRRASFEHYNTGDQNPGVMELSVRCLLN